MEQEKVDLFLTAHGDKFAVEQHLSIRQILLELSDDKFFVVQAIDFKSPTTILIISVLLGGYGVDRFMLKDKNAIWKLLTCGGCGIWSIIDIFSAQQRTKAYNYTLLQNAVK